MAYRKVGMGSDIQPVNGQCPYGWVPTNTSSDGVVCLPSDWAADADPFTGACPSGTSQQAWPPGIGGNARGYCAKAPWYTSPVVLIGAGVVGLVLLLKNR